MTVSQSQNGMAPNGQPEAEPSAEFFSLVFRGNLRALKRNPHTTQTPYGLPVVVGFGNAFAEFDEHIERYEMCIEALKLIADRASFGQRGQFRIIADLARETIAKAEGK